MVSRSQWRSWCVPPPAPHALDAYVARRPPLHRRSGSLYNRYEQSNATATWGRALTLACLGGHIMAVQHALACDQAAVAGLLHLYEVPTAVWSAVVRRTSGRTVHGAATDALNDVTAVRLSPLGAACVSGSPQVLAALLSHGRALGRGDFDRGLLQVACSATRQPPHPAQRQGSSTTAAAVLDMAPLTCVAYFGHAPLVPQLVAPTRGGHLGTPDTPSIIAVAEPEHQEVALNRAFAAAASNGHARVVSDIAVSLGFGRRSGDAPWCGAHQVVALDIDVQRAALCNDYTRGPHRNWLGTDHASPLVRAVRENHAPVCREFVQVSHPPQWCSARALLWLSHHCPCVVKETVS